MSSDPGDEDGIVGRYCTVRLDGTDYRTYYESSGGTAGGPAVVFLHTAGGDSRLFRYQLEDPSLREAARLVAFDMPYHGRSLPEGAWWTDRYRLTTAFYTEFVNAFVRTLDLGPTVLVGNSMGGYLMLDMALRQPRRHAAHVAVAPRAHEPAWTGLSKWIEHPDVNYNQMISTVSNSASSPDAPASHRRLVEWIYRQGNGYTLRGDFFYASEDHDLRGSLPEIDAAESELYLVGGRWDYSCRREHLDHLRERIPSMDEERVFLVDDAGHYVPTEDPDSFNPILRRVLRETT